jgi:hypothetical protein
MGDGFDAVFIERALQVLPISDVPRHQLDAPAGLGEDVVHVSAPVESHYLVPVLHELEGCK